MSVEALLAVQKLTAKTSHACFRVLMTLAEHADEHGGNTWPSIDTIAAEAQTDEKTVRRSLAKLQEDGLIAGDRGRGRGNTTVWRLLFPVLPLKRAGAAAGVSAADTAARADTAAKEGATPGIVRDAPPIKEGVTPGIAAGKEGMTPGTPAIKEGVAPVKEGMTPPEPVLNQKEESKSSLRSQRARDARLDEAFAAFYAAYPRKKKPDDARKAWTSVVRKGVEPATIMAALAGHQFRDDPEFIPYPGTWLRGGSWRDEPDATSPARAKARMSLNERIMHAAGLLHEPAGSAPEDMLRPARAGSWAERNSDEAVRRAAGIQRDGSGGSVPRSMLLEHVA